MVPLTGKSFGSSVICTTSTSLFVLEDGVVGLGLLEFVRSSISEYETGLTLLLLFLEGSSIMSVVALL